MNGGTHAALWLLSFIAALTTPAALVALGVALVNLQRLWGYRSQQNGDGLVHLVKPGAVRPSAPIARAGGLGVPVGPIPNGNQLNDPLPDGRMDPQAGFDCGEEVCADLLAWWGLPFLPAGVLRQVLVGWKGSGLTTADDLVRLLGWFRIPSHARTCAWATAKAEIERAIAIGLPCPVLGRWLTPNYDHWRLVTATSPSGLTASDPWGGVVVEMPWSVFAFSYRGQYVHIDGRPTPFKQIEPAQ